MHKLLTAALVALTTTSALHAQERPNLLAAPYLEAMTWTEIRDAIQGGKGLYVYHWASSAFTTDSAIDKEYERALAGGWRKQGNHGKPHAFSVTVRKDHPVTAGVTEFMHGPDELYQNSVMFPESTIIVAGIAEVMT